MDASHNHTPGGPLVRALRARAGILLLITNENSPPGLRAYGRRFGEKWMFENQILCIFMSNVLTTKIIIYFIDAIDSLGNHIYIFIDYNPLLRILGDEIHCCKT